ncbi:tetratricopeptide repeat protein [Azospirillum sp. TSA2s]|uniref:tetratricopeptide repeat protein n=1 Tax=Azospirillum sp. TSA2s TaxID=709810 RepID=UPI0010AA2BEC|nr:tetratricopeptide repeat protein [Azospirillum sp. TSA2s]QCG97957.1 tetratricopeptide repeat protein [Azospirillum sp. TSA2s]
MTETLSTFAETIWAWLNAEQNAGAVSAVLAVLTLAGGAGGWLWRRKSTAPAPDQTGGTYVSASTGGVGAGESMTGNTITTNHGATPEQIAAIFAGVRDLSQSSEAKAIATADHFGTISREALASFFTILRHEQVPPEHLTAKLTSIALQYREMVERLTALEQAASPDDRPTLAEVRAAIEKGDYDHAERLLVGLENAQAAARAKAQANADDLARRQAATRAERARLSTLRFDHRAAADHFLAAANLLPIGDTKKRCDYLTSSADALRQQGEERGDNEALRTAIVRYREAMPLRSDQPDLWARVQNNLGNALQTLGEYEGDSSQLRQGIDARNSALLELTRDRTPLQWAGIQSNLGNALSILGEREDDRVLLGQAVEAYKNALLELTRDRTPLLWASTQNNFGVALHTLGEHINDSILLQQAMDAYKSALLEYTRERIPLEWAMTQNNLGNALSIIGEREKDSARLRQAVGAYENALLERTSERVPLDWASTQTNLGSALQALAELTCDIDNAKQAVASHEAALKMFGNLRTPYYITVATNNLAAARATLAELESGADPAPHQ